jgi:hypothetical protein
VRSRPSLRLPLNAGAARSRRRTARPDERFRLRTPVAAYERNGDLTMISSIDLRLSSSRRPDSARGARCAAVISPGGLCGTRSRARDQLAQKSSGSEDPTVATERASALGCEVTNDLPTRRLRAGSWQPRECALARRTWRSLHRFRTAPRLAPISEPFRSAGGRIRARDLQFNERPPGRFRRMTAPDESRCEVLAVR